MSEFRFNKVRKRDGSIVDFDQHKIINAIFKAAQSVGGHDKTVAAKISEHVLNYLKDNFLDAEIIEIEQIQDAVEKALIEGGYAKTAKAYIIYRQKRSETRNVRGFLNKANEIIDDYVGGIDWRVKENSNASYSLSGLQAHISGALMAEYALNNIYPREVSEAHRQGDYHIHDLGNGTFSGYCSGWSLRQLLVMGFNGVPGRVAAKPAKHLNALLGQIVNFYGTLQNEWAGAQAFSSFDTYLAPFVAKDNLSYDQVKQSLQEFVFATNATSRWGNQVPFTNLTFDWVVPEDMHKEPAIIAGKQTENYYGDFQDEMDMINKAFIEIMTKGDMNGRIFTFPIPTYNITRDFNWNTDNAESLFEMTAKYGIPYFQNFVNSDLNPGDVRSMCCRLQLNLKELRNKTGGLFGSGEKTGSIGVVTLNMPRIGYISKTKDDFFDRTMHLMELAKTSLEIKRKEVTKYMDNGLLPWSKKYLGDLSHHFATIGLNGMNEACLNFLGTSIATKEGKDFALETLDVMRETLSKFQEETGNIYNLEATPAEGTAYRLAKIDKKKHPDIITSGEKIPYYTNSTHLPVDYTSDIFEALDHQDKLQSKYTGGTVLHGFIGEKISSNASCKKLVKRIAYNYRLPYYTVTPTFSICPVHGYIKGEHHSCPY